ncbi:MAG: DnaJ domain-containing protein [Elusimicrobiota bacterium]
MKRGAVFLFAGIIYLLWPYDLVPDFLVVVGWIDDLLVAALAVYLAIQAFRKQLGRAPRGPGPRSRAQAGGAAPDEEPVLDARPASEDPYELLGLRPGAGLDEIKQAYRREIAKYHPDKVQHLGAELKALAERKTKAIQQAYETLIED